VNDSYAALCPAEARHIDRTCDHFEAAWKAGSRPDPREYVGAAAGAMRSVLLRQLLLLDWDYRRRAGDAPQPDDYHARFPGDPALIEDIHRTMTQSPDSTQVGSEEPHFCDRPDADQEVGGIANPSHGDSGTVRYDLLREVGHGGIGVVFRGRDRLLGRELAIKVLREAYRDNPDARRRFTEEARVGSRLQHPAIVPVYELGWFDDRRPYFTMKLVEGQTLADLLAEGGGIELAGQETNGAASSPGGAARLQRLLPFFAQVCQAMAYAHARGVVHRDLKPANIMVGAFGEVQVMDWGFAKVLAPDGALEASAVEPATGNRECSASPPPSTGTNGHTHSGALMGTPAYMPPEQARGETALIDSRADVFALGTILCEILTGRPAYVGDTADELCHRAAAGDLRSAHAALDTCGADQALRELAKRCLAAERGDRPADAGHVARDLNAYLASAQERLRQAELERTAAEARAREAGAKTRAERRARRLTLALASAAIILLVLAGSGWRWYEHVQQAKASQVATTDSKVEAALAEAADWSHRQDWPQAVAALTRARELYDSGASAFWKERIDDMQADLDLIMEIEGIRLRQAEFDIIRRRFLLVNFLPQYAEAFARYGIAPGADPAFVTARIAQRPVPIHEALVASLNNWWLVARSQKDVHQWLGTVLQAADTDAWRVRMRRAVAQRDQRALEELAAQAAGQQPATISTLTWALFDFKASQAAIPMLQSAQQRHPRDFWINLDLGRALRLRQPPDDIGAARFFSIAQTLRPAESIYDYVLLAVCLRNVKDWDGAIFAAQKAIELQPDCAVAYHCLGGALNAKGNRQQAEAAYRKAAELEPNADNHYNLGNVLAKRGQPEQAIAAYERAIRLDPSNAGYYYNLGNAHHDRKDLDAALAAYDRSIQLDPREANVHVNRGYTLLEKGRKQEALADFATAVRLAPTMDKAQHGLGIAAGQLGDWGRAIAAHRRAVELNERSAAYQYQLGLAFQAIKAWGPAAAAFGKAVWFDPNDAEVQCSLGRALQEKGLFREGLDAIERGHQLGSQRRGWNRPSAQWLKEAQRLVALEAKLPGILNGSTKPATVQEQLEYASLCDRKELYRASARLYAEAFRVRPAPASSETHFRAACVAVLAGCNQGKDGSGGDAAERTRWRKQALDLLRADLAFWSDPQDRRPHKQVAAQKALQRMRQEKALAGIREPQELAKLPESERADYLRFWGNVQELLVRSLALAALERGEAHGSTDAGHAAGHGKVRMGEVAAAVGRGGNAGTRFQTPAIVSRTRLSIAPTDLRNIAVLLSLPTRCQFWPGVCSDLGCCGIWFTGIERFRCKTTTSPRRTLNRNNLVN
jgi:serine/threonine protein kinase/Flp pilus assembly protein TadD